MPDSSLTPILAFALVAALLVITPGVGTASLVATVIENGRRAGYLLAIGMVSGAALYAAGAALGTTALLHAFPGALRAIAIGGGAFIVLLGIKGLVAALRSAPSTPKPKPR